MVTDFAKKQRFKRLLYSPLSIILIIIISLFIAKGVLSMYGKYKQAKQQSDIIKKELSDLRNRKEYLQNELKALSSSSGFEERLRKSFDVKKEGENVAVIVRRGESDLNSAMREREMEENWISKMVVKIVDFLQ